MLAQWNQATLPNLQHLDLSNTQVLDGLPDHLWDMTNLTHLYFHNSGLTGTFPFVPHLLIGEVIDPLEPKSVSW